jgi:hypothetical protein
MTPQEFVHKWKPVALTERQAAQEHFGDQAQGAACSAKSRGRLLGSGPTDQLASQRNTDLYASSSRQLTRTTAYCGAHVSSATAALTTFSAKDARLSALL